MSKITYNKYMADSGHELGPNTKAWALTSLSCVLESVGPQRRHKQYVVGLSMQWKWGH